jgi:hypothetical protein
MADLGNYDDFVPGEHVELVENGKTGFVHHNFQFPGEPWKFAIDFEDGTQGVYTTDELRYVEDDDEG